jgi:hypothetical protein
MFTHADKSADTHADESAKRCEDSKPTARVEDNENIALMVYHDLLCDENGRPTEGAFQFSRLLLKSKDTKDYPHNSCGESQGVSVERGICTRMDELLQKSEEFANAKSTNTKVQQSKGVAIAKVGCLRQIRFDTTQEVKRNKLTETISPSEQLVFILADGGQDNPYHAVVRLHKKIDRILHKKVVESLEQHSYNSQVGLVVDLTPRGQSKSLRVPPKVPTFRAILLI